MTYLFLQIWMWLLAAFILGWLAHWFLFSREKSEAATSKKTSSFLGVLTDGEVPQNDLEDIIKNGDSNFDESLKPKE